MLTHLIGIPAKLGRLDLAQAIWLKHHLRNRWPVLVRIA